MVQLLINFASDTQKLKLIANKVVETAAREDGWGNLAEKCNAVSVDIASYLRDPSERETMDHVSKVQSSRLCFITHRASTE